MEMHGIRDRILTVLDYTSSVAHVVISMALVAATLLITVFFFHEIYDAVRIHTLIKGFLHALGSLLLLWTMVELISTEIRFLRGGVVDVAIFIEVGLIVIVREIIMLPVAETTPGWIDVGTWVVAAAMLGLTYFLVRVGKRMAKMEIDAEYRSGVRSEGNN